MEKLPVADRILQYRFPPEPGKHYGFNITVLFDEDAKRALLIDAAYEEQAAAVRSDLTEWGFDIGGVIVSHFHPDHVTGLKVLPPVAVYGSTRYEETLRHYPDNEERRAFAPTHPVSDASQFRFGTFEISFRLAPGHSPCSMLTLVGERFVHVADNIMTSNAGQDILPWAEFDLIEDHVRSLEALRKFGSRTLLLSHGIVLEEEGGIDRAIADRLSYFRAVLEGSGRISYGEAVKNCTCDFLHSEWFIRKE